MLSRVFSDDSKNVRLLTHFDSNVIRIGKTSLSKLWRLLSNRKGEIPNTEWHDMKNVTNIKLLKYDKLTCGKSQFPNQFFYFRRARSRARVDKKCSDQLQNNRPRLVSHPFQGFYKRTSEWRARSKSLLSFFNDLHGIKRVFGCPGALCMVLWCKFSENCQKLG